MKVINKIITAGVISAITVSCLTPLVASAKTTETDSIPAVTFTKVIQDVSEDEDNAISFFGIDLTDSTDFSFDDTGDIIYEGALVPDDVTFEFDYGDLTEAEIKELEEIYSRYEAIFEEICPSLDEELSEEEFEKRVEKYADELEKLNKRAEELEKKAGWSDYIDAFEDELKDLENSEFFNDLVKDLDIDPNADIDDISADQVVDIVGSIIDKLDAEDLGKLINGIDTGAANEIITEMKQIVKTDEFKDLVGDIINAVSTFSDEF